MTLKIETKFRQFNPERGAKWRWGRLESTICDLYLTISQKLGTLLLWKANRNLHALYLMVTPNHRIFDIWYCVSYLHSECR